MERSCGLARDLVGLHQVSGAEGEISLWPGDAEFTEFLRTREVYGTVSQPRLVTALAAAEASPYRKDTDVPVLADNLSLNRLVPKEWEKYWLLTDTDGAALEGEAFRLATAERWARLNQLGNLTIVTQPLNAAMSNSP